jgi:AraC family transcriptional regulator
MNAHPDLRLSPFLSRGCCEERRVATSSFDLGWPNVHARITDLPCPQVKTRAAVPEVHVVNYVIAGNVTVSWRRGRRCQESQLQPGDVTIVPAHDANAVRIAGGWSTMLHWIVPSELLATVAAEEFGNRLPQIPLQPSLGCRDRSIVEYCASLATELQQPETRSPVHVEFLTRALAVHLLRHSNSFEAPARAAAGTLSADKLRAAIDFVHDNLNWNLSLEEVAGATGDSPCHFARMFRRTTGKTPHQYVIARRVECAKQLLAAGELSIAAIANDTGFASQSHLTEVFRKITGVTPKAFQDDVGRNKSHARCHATRGSTRFANVGK